MVPKSRAIAASMPQRWVPIDEVAIGNGNPVLKNEYPIVLIDSFYSLEVLIL
jgi:hypothetical protein